MVSRFTRRLLTLGLVAALLAGLVGLVAVFWKRDRGVHPFVTSAAFAPRELGRTYQVFDLGVTDVDGDARLDVFTVNHSNRQLLLLARDDGTFEERLVDLGLSQSADFPGVEAGYEQPMYERAGLFVHWREEKLIVRASGGFAAAGRIELPRALKVATRGNATVSTTGGSSLRFVLPGSGSVEIAADEYDFSPRFELDEAVSLTSVFVGPGCVSPRKHAFRLPTQDRHGMAWADFDGDGDQDVFVARGGGIGRLQELEPDARDEFFVFEEGRFVDRIEEAGFEKLGCPARSVRWVDATGDGLLDLFIVCGRNEPPNADAPNQLFVQGPRGRFHERAAVCGLDIRGLGFAHWLDAGQDGDMDLFWASRSSVSLFRNERGAFREEVLVSHPGEAQQLTAADFDLDGDLDVYLASMGGSRVFTGDGEHFLAQDPSALGLPGTSFAANWVDYDNDGLLDIHLLPQGLYRQQALGSFAETSLLAQRRSGIDAISSWFDFDGDGLRDFVVAVPDWSADALHRLRDMLGGPERFPPRAWRVLLYRNMHPTSNEWIQVELVGPRGNRAAIGARVELRSAHGSTVAEVGQFDGSMRSQGHTRLYFGLGETAQTLGLNVVWPDGSARWIDAPATRRLMVVEYDHP
ncbi:MAG: CRTAC1 family protein [Planctomycetes bacterium]|nr:CRTAC1 family protein [Planctomycetota bacterium]